MKRSLIIPVLVAAMLLCACAAPAVSADTNKPYVSVSFGYADGLRYAPSYAIWVQDEAGNVATLYATAKAAADSWGSQPRENVLPVWKGVREGADVVSGATPKNGASLTLNIPETFVGKKLTLYIEANASYDYNEYYAEGLSEGDAGYNDVNGQPSVVWTMTLDPSTPTGTAAPALAGTGEVLGADHAVHETEHLTTAAGLLTDITVEWKLGE